MCKPDIEFVKNYNTMGMAIKAISNAEPVERVKCDECYIRHLELKIEHLQKYAKRFSHYNMIPAE